MRTPGFCKQSIHKLRNFPDSGTAKKVTLLKHAAAAVYLLGEAKVVTALELVESVTDRKGCCYKDKAL